MARHPDLIKIRAGSYHFKGWRIDKHDKCWHLTAPKNTPPGIAGVLTHRTLEGACDAVTTAQRRWWPCGWGARDGAIRPAVPTPQVWLDGDAAPLEPSQTRDRLHRLLMTALNARTFWEAQQSLMREALEAAERRADQHADTLARTRARSIHNHLTRGA